MIATVWSPFGVPALRDNHRYWSAEAQPLIDMGSSTRVVIRELKKKRKCQVEPYHTNRTNPEGRVDCQQPIYFREFV